MPAAVQAAQCHPTPITAPILAVISTADPDPVFTLIQAHMKAYADYRTDIACGGPDELPEGVEDDEEGIAWKALMHSDPTTPAGIAALLDYVRMHALANWSGDIYWDLKQLAAFLENVSFAVRRLPAYQKEGK